MTTPWIATALAHLRSYIAAANHTGNVDGLLARYLLGNDSRIKLEWLVDCDELWMQEYYDPTNLACVAALAYTLEHTGDLTKIAVLEAGLQRAAARDVKVAGHGAALHDPAVLVGLCLGANLLKNQSKQYITWCGVVTQQLVLSPRNGRIDPVVAYAFGLCSVGALNQNLQLDMQAPLIDRAALDWWYRRPEHLGIVSVDSVRALRTSVVEEAISEPLEQIPGYQAALLWKSLRLAVTETIADALQTPATIAHALRQFETCMKRWRWDPEKLQHPIRWTIRSEREVQDILWMMLRPLCLDLEDEDTLPKFGHSTYRSDFGIPSLGLLIEVKYARSSSDFKLIEKEVLEDIVPYLKSPERYREVLVFIYDESCSVQEHDTTSRALRTVGGISDVIIVCRPSQLPETRR